MQLILMTTQLPLIGFLVIMSVPGLSAGILEAFHVTGKGGAPGPNLLFIALTSRKHNGRLFAMGALVFIVGILSISLMLSPNEFLPDPDVMSRIEQGDLDAVAELDQGTVGRMMLAVLIGVAVSGTLSYFTVPLIWFGDLKLGAALATGLKALAVNWKAFLLLAFGLVAVLVPVSIVVAILFGMAGSGGPVAFIVMGLIMLLMLAFQLMLFGTQYTSFVEIFGMEAGEEPTPPPDDDSQLVA